MIATAADPEAEHAKFAQAALSYVVAEDDAVPDKLGVLGFLDDIFVVEWAYAFITGATARLPLFELALSEWPFLEELVFEDNAGLLTLDRYLSYTVGVVLFSLFESNPRSLVVVRESGPVALLAGTIAAIACQRRASAKNQAPSLQKGMPIFIGDDVKAFRAVYQGCEAIHGRLVHWIEVGKRGRITIDDSALQFTWPASQAHGRPLASGNELLEWMQTRHPSALTFISGSMRHLTADRPGILLVTKRRRLEELCADLRPFGLPLTTLADIQYIASTNTRSSFNVAASGAPPICAVSDDNVAMDLIKSPPKHVSSWLVIVDGSQAGLDLCAAMGANAETANVSVCVVAELHERERCQGLSQLGFATWFAEFSDVGIDADVASFKRDDPGPLRRFIARSAVNTAARESYTKVENAGFEMLDDAVYALSRSEQAKAGGPLERLAIHVARFCKKATSHPLAGDTETQQELRVLAGSIRDEAQRYRMFYIEARSIFEIFDLLISEDYFCPDRGVVIRSIVANAPDDVAFGVVVATAGVAEACKMATSGDSILGKVEWLSLDQLRQRNPLERLIVATWLGRAAMRELSHGGFAQQIDYVLLSFEQRWLESTRGALARWRRELTTETDRHESNVIASFRERGLGPSVWSRWKAIKHVVEEADDLYGQSQVESELDILETRVADAIRSIRHTEVRDLIRARLVLFEQTGAYAYLPPAGRVIALSTVAEAGQDAERKAEERLSCRTEALRPGMVVAFASGSARDLVDARSDHFLKDAASVRQRADLWRQAVRRYLAGGRTPEQLSALLAGAGEPREPSTIQSWAFGNSIVAALR